MVKRRRFLEQAKKYAVQYVRTVLPADPESLIGKAVDFVLSDEYISIILKEIGACTSKILDETIDISRCYSDLIRTLTDDIHFICRHRMLPFNFVMSGAFLNFRFSEYCTINDLTYMNKIWYYI